MTYQSFIDNTIDALIPMLPKEADIRSEKIQKNNGFAPWALIIQTPTQNIFPTIYLDDYYERAKRGDSLDIIYKDILDTYNAHKIEGMIDTSCLSEFEKIKDKIALRLVNKKKNKALFSEVPHINFLDMALVPSIIFNNDTDFYAGSLIKKSNLKEWKISEDVLFSWAKENTRRVLPGKISSIYEFLGDMVGNIIEPCECDRNYMHIFTNERRTHGAVCMTYKDMLSEFAEKMESDIFILPSSIHEIMLIADDGNSSLEDYSELVKEVNETQVDIPEVLSDHAYLFKRDSGEIIY